VRRSLVALLVLAAWPSVASAAPVLVRAANGRVHAGNDRYLIGSALTPAPAERGTRRHFTLRGSVSAELRRAKPTVPSVLTGLYRRQAITTGAYHAYEQSFNQALAAERRLRGTRRAELSAVTVNLHQMALAGTLTASRLPVLFQTLDRNRQWWTTGPLLSSGQRVEFQGSQLVWEYYPGQGIQLQVLGSFGKADGLYTAGRSQYGSLTTLLSQLIPLAAQRGGGLTWEYYFHFDGGTPPWTSAMSQATGLEALSRGFKASHNGYYLQVAQQALPVFTARAPAGVAVPTRLGARFIQYTFTPGTSIINAFLQTLIGLQSYAQVSHNPLAAQLFAKGNREAEAEVPHFDTGAWSLYQPGVEDSLSYHELVTGFLLELCGSTGAPVYCTTARHFQTYLTTAPALTQLTFRARARRLTTIRFGLSKYSHVGIVLTRGASTVFQTSGWFGYGTDHVTVPFLRAGADSLHIAATDLAGNFNRVSGGLEVSR
jgi:hypothetical protein